MFPLGGIQRALGAPPVYSNYRCSDNGWGITAVAITAGVCCNSEKRRGRGDAPGRDGGSRFPRREDRWHFPPARRHSTADAAVSVAAPRRFRPVPGRLASLRSLAEDFPPGHQNDPGFTPALPPPRPDSARFRGFGGAFSRSPGRFAFRPVTTRICASRKVYIIGPIGS